MEEDLRLGRGGGYEYPSIGIPLNNCVKITKYLYNTRECIVPIFRDLQTKYTNIL